MSEQRGDYLSDQSIDRLGGYRDLLRDLERRAVQIDRSGASDEDLIFESQVWDTLDELGDLLLSKHHDYGPLNIAHSPGGPVNGLRVRIWDKIARINNLVDKGTSPEHEALEDSFKDLANYGIIGLLVLRGHWPETEGKSQ